MTDAEIAGFMNWRGPGAYTASQLARVRRIVEEVQRRETKAACDIVDYELDSNGHAEAIKLAIQARGKA